MVWSKLRRRVHMPWHGDIAHTKLSDGRVVLRGSSEEAQHKFQEQFPYPHCNSEVLHAPGTCQYCDMYPDRQAMRAAGNTPFTPAESNGWYGNVASHG